MNIDHIRAIAEKNMKKRRTHREREAGFVYYHGQRVANGVIALRKRITDDAFHDDILRCAAMFHDVCKGYTDHSNTGAALAPVLLSGELNDQEMREVCRLIGAHDHRAPGTGTWDVWAQLLQDADLLDHFGTLETWINFHYYAYEGGDIQESVEFYKNEFFDEAAKHRKKLNFEESIRIFDEKVTFARAFYERMRIEAQGKYVI